MIDPVLPDKPILSNVREARKEVHYRLIGQMRKIPGLKQYKYNLSTGEITELKIEKKVMVNLEGKPIKQNKAIFEENYLYWFTIFTNKD